MAASAPPSARRQATTCSSVATSRTAPISTGTQVPLEIANASPEAAAAATSANANRSVRNTGRARDRSSG